MNDENIAKDGEMGGAADSRLEFKAECETRMQLQNQPTGNQATARPEPSPADKTPVSFSVELRGLANRFDGRPVELGAILEKTNGRGFNLLLILITLPFISPVPLPGFSIPFGLVIALIGTRFALGQTPWLPERLLKRKLPARSVGRVLRGAGRIVNLLEYLLRPRLALLHDHAGFRRVAGILTALSGLLMLAPLPVPFTNSLPAWTVLLLAAGAVERDGLFFIAGCVSFAVTAAFFILLVAGGTELVQSVLQAAPRR